MQKLILPIKDFKPTAGYKNYKYRKYWGYNHYGVDCGSPSKNRALYGLGDGVVVAAGLDGLNGKTTGKGSGCGYCLIIIYKDCYNRRTQKATDVVCTYMHMAALPKVKAGEKVTTKTLLDITATPEPPPAGRICTSSSTRTRLTRFTAPEFRAADTRFCAAGAWTAL